MRRTGRLLLFVTTLILVVASCDAIVFRSGFYQRTIMEPQSTAGATLDAIAVIKRYYIPGGKNILVLGNSQIGEGFSQVLADQAAQRPEVNFINGAVPGTGLRLWYYLLREVDPHADRFSALALAVPYDPGLLKGEDANYSLDIACASPLLRLEDLTDFPATFNDPALAQRARRAILFPAQPLREDIAGFLRSPIDRVRHAREWWKAYAGSFQNYSGRAAALPDLPLDRQTHEPSDWLGREDELKPLLSSYFSGLRSSSTSAPAPALRAKNDDYYREWLTRIAAPYRAKGIPVILFEAPRGPWHYALRPKPDPGGSVAALASTGMFAILPGDTFTELEQPRFFFDSLHMNRAGRERFSPLLGKRISALLH